MLARAKGKQVFKQTCVACHGEDGKGIEGLGKNWTTSEYIASSTNDELIEFLKVGRTIEDPANTTGILMPPRGGNPNLTDDDLRNVVLYMRKLIEG
jgi:disulfide bond formation protein DsbB